jgi:hypothetical protein
MTRTLLILAAAGLLAAAAMAQTGTGTLTGSISRTGSTCGKNTCWTCSQPVNLARVTVTVNSPTDREDAVKFAKGCTGLIRRLTIVTDSGDGVKVAPGSHDLKIIAGSVACIGKAPTVHQDGIQALGGDRILFRGMVVRCPVTPPLKGALNHSAFFVNGNPPPTQIIFEYGLLGSTGTTVDIGTSDASGVRYSTICPSTTVRTPFLVPLAPSGGGPPATNVVDVGNTRAAACP